jgi:DNA-binding FadR family transcriptional regulator
MSMDPAFNQRLIQAIQRRDPDAAEAAVVDHLEETLDVVQMAWNGMQRTGRTGASDEEPSSSGHRP